MLNATCKHECFTKVKLLRACCGVAGLWAVLLAGCGDDGPARINVSGDVTWKGGPIPSGYMTLSPDVKKGNSGPQGIAFIKDGKFDTRFKGGRGAATGPQLLNVYGYDGVNPSEDHPWGAPLFLQHETKITVSEVQEPIKLVVPDSAKPAPR